MGLEDDLTLSALVPQNALPSDLLENALCGVAFGLGVLGIVMGIVFFICSQRRCSDGKSLGKVREPGIRVPVWVCARILLLVWGPVFSMQGCILLSGDPVTHTVNGENRNSLEQGMRSPGDLWETCLVMT